MKGPVTFQEIWPRLLQELSSVWRICTGPTTLSKIAFDLREKLPIATERRLPLQDAQKEGLQGLPPLSRVPSQSLFDILRYIPNGQHRHDCMMQSF